METVLSKAASQPLPTFVRFSQTFGGTEHIASLLSCTATTGPRTHAGVLAHLAHVLAALTYGNPEKMALLCAHFQPVLDFNRFDFEHTPEDEHKVGKLRERTRLCQLRSCVHIVVCVRSSNSSAC